MKSGMMRGLERNTTCEWITFITFGLSHNFISCSILGSMSSLSWVPCTSASYLQTGEFSFSHALRGSLKAFVLGMSFIQACRPVMTALQSKMSTLGDRRLQCGCELFRVGSVLCCIRGVYWHRCYYPTGDLSCLVRDIPF